MLERWWKGKQEHFLALVEVSCSGAAVQYFDVSGDFRSMKLRVCERKGYTHDFGICACRSGRPRRRLSPRPAGDATRGHDGKLLIFCYEKEAETGINSAIVVVIST